MTSAMAFRRSGWRSAASRRAVLHLVAGLPIGALAGLVLLILPVSLWWSAAWGVTDLPHAWQDTVFYLVLTGLSPVPLLWCVRGLSTLQRGRFRETLRVGFDAPRRPAGPWLRRQVAGWRSASTWRQLGYHLLNLAGWIVLYLLVVAGWTAAAGLGVRPVSGGSIAIAALLVLALPRLARVLALADLAAARALLGPSREEQLALRVESLTRSRAEIVEATDAERRRIERDLHDGAQQRLVSLAMNLGMARAALADAPEPARQAIAEAHDEAKQALAELRDLVRGLHPAVLDDRGLDAALSGIAARAPLPVSLHVDRDVDVPARCSPTVEAVAYFVVSEALTNVAKHAAATHADVTVGRVGDRLRVAVTDDGRGGAVLDGGSGLRGLAQRAASVDGTLTVESPAGGPTMIVVELPCAS